jgi:histidyl-tRNA synthetase
VLVASIGPFLEQRMAVCAELWSAGIAAEFVYKENPKLPVQLAYADETQIPLAVIFGDTELANGTIVVNRSNGGFSLFVMDYS